MVPTGRPESSGYCDVQTHYVPLRAAQWLAEHRARGKMVHGIGSIDADELMRGLDARLRIMDKTGVAVSVLSLAPISVGPNTDATDLYRWANDGLLAACSRWPSRFVAAIGLPLSRPLQAEAELERVGREPAARAIQVVAHATSYRLDDVASRGLLQSAAAHRLPLLLHPSAGTADLSRHFDDYGLSSGMHAMISHALVAARLVQSGTLDLIPGLELIMTHLGGVLPFLSERLDSRAHGPAKHPTSHYLKTRMHFDVCGFSAGPSMRCALEVLSPQRLLLGSDWPSRRIEAAIDAVRGLHLDAESEANILRNNAMRWFDPAAPRRRRDAGQSDSGGAPQSSPASPPVKPGASGR